ncbi:hypothetical protein Tco_0598115 [Tanacetum coccineum]
MTGGDAYPSSNRYSLLHLHQLTTSASCYIPPRIQTTANIVIAMPVMSNNDSGFCRNFGRGKDITPKVRTQHKTCINHDKEWNMLCKMTWPKQSQRSDKSKSKFTQTNNSQNQSVIEELILVASQPLLMGRGEDLSILTKLVKTKAASINDNITHLCAMTEAMMTLKTRPRL